MCTSFAKSGCMFSENLSARCRPRTEVEEIRSLCFRVFFDKQSSNNNLLTHNCTNGCMFMVSATDMVVVSVVEMVLAIFS